MTPAEHTLCAPLPPAPTQFHAVALLHALRASDRLAISKLVSSLTKASVKSPLAQCLLVRYVAQVIQDSQPGPNGEQRPFYDFLESCLRHKAEMVIFEAARAICNLKDVTARELTPAITVLQLFLSSSKPVLRFAAVRTLNKVAMTHPLAVTSCNIDMESLIADQNRSIATLAITTLLKTGNEASVEKLLKQIGSFMSDIADDFKIVVVEAIRSLCLKFPQKHRALMNFLSNVLREEGGFEYKKAIVNSILVLIQVCVLVLISRCVFWSGPAWRAGIWGRQRGMSVVHVAADMHAQLGNAMMVLWCGAIPSCACDVTFA